MVPSHVLRRSVLLVGSSGHASYDSEQDELVAVQGPYPDRTVTYAQSVESELRHWLDCLDAVTEPLVTPSQARTSIEIALAAENSARADGTPILLAESSFVP